MPTMDGIEATKNIVKLYNTRLKRKLSDMDRQVCKNQKRISQLHVSDSFKLKHGLLRKHSQEVSQERPFSIVAVTAYTSDEVEQDCCNAGMQKVLAKPLDFGNLQKVMAKYYFQRDMICRQKKM